MPGKLTIGMPISSFLPALGGMEVGLHNIAKRLAALGHRPIVMAPWSNVRALKSSRRQLPYEVVAFPPKLPTLVERAPGAALSVFDLFFGWMRRRYGIDVWHGTMGYPIGIALAHYGRHHPLPALVRCAGQDIQMDAAIGYGMRLDPRVDALVRQWLPRVPLLVAITDSVAGEYRALGVPDDRIAHIPNGIGLARFGHGRARAETRRALGVPQDIFIFLTVARNHPKKNLRAVVDAARLMAQADDLPEWRVVIVGKDAPALGAVVRDGGLSERVHLLEEIGPADEAAEEEGELPARRLIDLYRAADAFVFPSLIETFGIAIVEAMAAGLPVIVGDAPGCRDVVGNGRYGIMVPPRDMAALATAMRRLLQDPGERGRLADLAWERARHFDWDHVVARYLAAYDDLLGRRR